MKEFWIKLDSSLPKESKEQIIRNTDEFCTAYVVEPIDESLARKLGAKTLVSQKDGDIVLFESAEKVLDTKMGKRRCVQTKICSGEDEKKAIKLAEAGIEYVVAKCEDWKVIPLENLIASTRGKTKLLASISSADEAALALEVLEVGVDGVLVELSDVNEIKMVYEAFKRMSAKFVEEEEAEKLQIFEAKVTQIKPLRSGARTCIDTCDLMGEGEGMLVGCQSSGLFLIQAETAENPFVAPRPFRVNAGSTAQYLLAGEGNTKYLSEIRAGDEVLIVDKEGRSRVANVCRTKIEWRPLLLIEAEHKSRTFKIILQNAETIRLVTKNGSKSVKDLSKGDIVLVHIQEGGRHFGKLVKEERVIEQ
ncbi:MAG: 3-dehydroquinate synthase II [Candidatus Bathycorpusculaceae bacterium]